MRSVESVVRLMQRTTPGVWRTNGDQISAHRPLRVTGVVGTVLSSADAEFICRAKNEIIPFLVGKVNELGKQNVELRRELYWLRKENETS